MIYNLSITEVIRFDWTHEMVCDGLTLVSCTGRQINMEKCLEGSAENLAELAGKLAKEQISEQDYLFTSKLMLETWVFNEVESFVREHNQHALSKSLTKGAA